MNLGLAQTGITVAEVARREGVDIGPRGISVTIKPLTKAQTESQRGIYWASLHEFGEYLGYTKRESETFLHNAVLCYAYGVKETKRIGGSVVEIPNQRSSKANRDEYSELIQALSVVAAGAGFTFKRGE